MKKYKYPMMKCKTCDTDFRPLKENQLHCSVECRMVLTTCKQCGNDFRYYWLKSRDYCSKKCSGLSQRVNRKIIKCTNCGNDIKVREKNNYTKYCDRKCKDEYQKIMFSGENNPNYGNSKLKGIKRTEEDVKKIKKGIKESWKKPDRLIKHYEAIERYKEIHGTYPMQSEASKDKAAKSYRDGVADGRIKQVTHGKRGHYISLKTGIEEYFHSSWEHIRMMELDEDDDVVYWTKKHKICIKLGKRRWYIPDFLIEYKNGKKVLEEVKGYVRNKELFNLQIQKANEYIESNNITEYKVNFMEHLK